MDPILVTPLLQQEINHMVAKRTCLQRHINDLSTLIVGSSHGDCAFNPAFSADSFNLCSSAQDLRHSVALYEKCSELNPRIKNIVLFYSVFSPGHILERTADKERCAALKELFQLDLTYTDPVVCQSYNNIKGRLGSYRIENDVRGFQRSNAAIVSHQDEATVLARAAGHLKQNQRRTEALHIVRLLLAAQARQQRVFIVVPPGRSDYCAAMGMESDELFDDLRQIESMLFGFKVNVINLYGSFLFTDDHFADTDHLLPEGDGTALLTKTIHNHITLAA